LRVANMTLLPHRLRREFADSKTLSEEKRERLFEQLKRDESIGYIAVSTSAREISNQMLARDVVSLNNIAAEDTFQLIDEALERGVNLTEVYVDTVGDADRYKVRKTILICNCLVDVLNILQECRKIRSIAYSQAFSPT
jgi:ribonuclease HII